eukprot:4263225-Amphidinium_carterae.1
MQWARVLHRAFNLPPLASHTNRVFRGTDHAPAHRSWRETRRTGSHSCCVRGQLPMLAYSVFENHKAGSPSSDYLSLAAITEYSVSTYPMMQEETEDEVRSEAAVSMVQEDSTFVGQGALEFEEVVVPLTQAAHCLASCYSTPARFHRRFVSTWHEGVLTRAIPC